MTFGYEIDLFCDTEEGKIYLAVDCQLLLLYVLECEVCVAAVVFHSGDLCGELVPA